MVRMVWTTAYLAALVAAIPALAQAATCDVENRLGLRVVQCDEDATTTREAMVRTQSACRNLLAEDQAACDEAIAESFALRRESMIRRLLRAGASADSITSRYAATAEEIQKVQAEMATGLSTIDPEAQARAAEELRAITQQLEDWRLQQDEPY